MAISSPALEAAVARATHALRAAGLISEALAWQDEGGLVLGRRLVIPGSQRGALLCATHPPSLDRARHRQPCRPGRIHHDDECDHLALFGPLCGKDCVDSHASLESYVAHRLADPIAFATGRSTREVLAVMGERIHLARALGELDTPWAVAPLDETLFA